MNRGSKVLRRHRNEASMLQLEIIMKQGFCLTIARKQCGRWAATCGLTLVLSTLFVNVPGTSTAQAATCAKMMDAKVQEWTGDIINIVPWVAQDQGIFSKHCVNVTFVPLVSGPGSYAAMVSGTIAFANGAMDGIMRSRVQGVDLRMTGNMYAAQWSAL